MNAPNAARAAKILVVEDEPLLLLSASDFLEEAGFEVVTARNADEAIIALETQHDICIVFTDIDMPGSMDGLKLAEAVRGRWPPIKIVVASGHYSHRAPQLPEGGVFFKKPFETQQVVEVMQAMAA